MAGYCVRLFPHMISTYVFIFADSDCDIIDEALQYFKANVFFKNYEIKVR